MTSSNQWSSAVGLELLDVYSIVTPNVFQLRTRTTQATPNTVLRISNANSGATNYSNCDFSLGPTGVLTVTPTPVATGSLIVNGSTTVTNATTPSNTVAISVDATGYATIDANGGRVYTGAADSLYVPGGNIYLGGSINIGGATGNIGTGYQSYGLLGGNSTGYLQGNFNAFGDGVDLMYNMSAPVNGDATPITFPVNFTASRIHVGYNNIQLLVGTVNSTPPTLGMVLNGTTAVINGNTTITNATTPANTVVISVDASGYATIDASGNRVYVGAADGLYVPGGNIYLGALTTPLNSRVSTAVTFSGPGISPVITFICVRFGNLITLSVAETAVTPTIATYFTSTAGALTAAYRPAVLKNLPIYIVSGVAKMGLLQITTAGTMSIYGGLAPSDSFVIGACSININVCYNL